MNKQMKLSMLPSTKTASAVGIALAIALTAAPSTTTSQIMLAKANARAITGFDVPAPPAETIDFDRLVHMTVKVPSDSGLTDKGSSGYTVTVARLNIDPINTTQGYTNAARLGVLDARKLVNKSETFKKITDDEGQAEFDGLKPGAYLVTAEPPTSGGSKPQPDVIVIPIVGQDGQWKYDFTRTVKFEPKPHTPTTPPIPPIIPPTVTKTITPPPPTQPETPSIPDPTKKPKSLPVTGVQVIGIVGAAAILIILGFALLMAARRKRKQTSETLNKK
ncbi:LPXTG cell wall anchor domain-containing protein [Corynebacterium diphtheriae]|uniref:LPXTG cell wall anchor domain-containing protein n=1 Tax=Corynebacterium diphtheriae TaxID=1717 RepID=UPI0013C5D9CF|nr:LPXTG cell wall anchor domain-containing protein [Corynebacterium diphtheriae]UJL52915.1 LPXTG cell wall anchor domain-containing protein [Corynebacterium diphtheriae]CAB0580016.1 LPXTG cell wall anchor domain-containing protein [Corynebacterium diphtheriae]CAB0628157.1 LPXTG cell wall anchor domain-containing protein [Corynebacterium diphtheriae]CAB0719246.1 LPXTG cell wall anchor domain-containing protein [Corynebacterium diphtheriae]